MKAAKHIPLKEWKVLLNDADSRGLLQEVFADFCNYYFKHRPMMTNAEQCAFNQLGVTFQEKLKGVADER